MVRYEYHYRQGVPIFIVIMVLWYWSMCDAIVSKVVSPPFCSHALSLGSLGMSAIFRDSFASVISRHWSVKNFVSGFQDRKWFN